MRNTLIIISIFLLTACSIKFTLKGASVPDNLKTFSVKYFENRAPLVNPSLSQDFTEALKDRITSESRLNLVDSNGDVEFSGEIKGYNVRPMSIQSNAESAETRLTISIKVRYRNFKDPKSNWEQTFSAYDNFQSDLSINEVEGTLVKNIIEQITEDIFNKAFSSW